MPTLVEPLWRERLYLSSDVGRPRPALEAEFPQFDFSGLPMPSSSSSSGRGSSDTEANATAAMAAVGSSGAWWYTQPGVEIAEVGQME